MKFKITTEERKVGRNTSVSIYVNRQSIWTLNKKELTPDVQNAIKNAFRLGMEAQENRVLQRLNEYNNVDWEEPK